jgi:hypothetical protein
MQSNQMNHLSADIKLIFQAYSLHDREVGYCQGSAFIVGLVLMQVRLFITTAILEFNLF